ncbi:hypothetical protein F4820DRAFT_254688 [Hypoxylon rubiginosum]|uniref:Uncharacterized protein n=1 Tax=Hypoxylon rubiginosum TaxID=110542 RepID=A0ACB9ZF82_9PEZI|nr:hypothetical protein F4820DRAFT_254688 [Hypoxylon rubiginosum]
MAAGSKHVASRTALLLFLCLWGAAGVAATNPKANEYKSEDCSGDKNFSHAANGLTWVTMDDSSHCVYLANQDWDTRTWQAYSEKTADDGLCWGDVLGNLGGEEHNLDRTYGKRIKCLLNCATNDGATRFDKCRVVGDFIKKDKANDRGSPWFRY